MVRRVCAVCALFNYARARSGVHPFDFEAPTATAAAAERVVRRLTSDTDDNECTTATVKREAMRGNW